MLYNAYELQRTMLSGASAWASLTSKVMSNPALPFGYLGLGPVVASALDVFAHASEPRGKPAFGIDTFTVNGKQHRVTESIVMHKTFGNLMRFSHDGLPANAPKLLIAAPMSGHYATLLRGTVSRMLERCAVYVTDWADAKMVTVEEGQFDLNDYIDHIIEFLEFIGPVTHALAVCQPSVPTFAATAIMAENNNPCRPASLTMMGGPIDTRESPTAVNDVAVQQPIDWFENNVIASVPLTYPGSGRTVYPGFMQLAGFMSMNLSSHLKSHYSMFSHLVAGDGESADATKAFYDEYRSVCDMTSEFYLQTVEQVFQRHSLPNGTFMHCGKPVDLGAIKDTAILAIEGENDDISGLGQTKAALSLTENLPEAAKKYFMVEDVGHYGIFNGSTWRGTIAPVVEEWITTHNK